MSSLKWSSTCVSSPSKILFEAWKAAALALEKQVGIVEGRAVDQQVGLGLVGDVLQPLALRGAPVLRL